MTLPPSMLSWPPEALEEYEQRAAAREYLGKMPRARAEALAEADTRRWWSSGGDAAFVEAVGGFRSHPGHVLKHKRGPALTEPLSPKLPRHDSNMRPGD